jgi:Pretoxin HINT domain
MRNLFILLAICFTCCGVQAHAQTTDLDWVSKWGTVDLTSDNDPVIPAARHGAKRDIKAAISGCKPAPQDPNYSKLKGYEVDFDGDGLMDIVIDPAGYFAGEAQLPTCPVHICREDGCNTPVYHNEGDTQIIEGKPTADNPCPASAEANTTCRKECSATEKQCPALFNHVRNVAWSGYAFSTSFITTDAYMAMREANKNGFSDKRYIYRAALNKNPVFRAVRDRSYCNLEEMDVNHDGVVSSSEGCIKYMQYTTNQSLCSGLDGCFVDLYYPTVIVNASDDSARFIEDTLVSNVAQHFFDPTYAVAGRGSRTVKDASGQLYDLQGQGYNLEAGHAIASQVPNFDVNAGLEDCKDVTTTEKVCSGGIGRQLVGEEDCHMETKTQKVCTQAQPNIQFVCKEYYNRSSKGVFIPAETDQEYQSFIKAVTTGSLQDISIRECERKFTPWVGQTSCAGVQVACNEVKKIAAERSCIRSTSSKGACTECTGKDTQVIDGFKDSCSFSAECRGEVCPEAHTFCVTADTKVLMADGSEKAINEINVGDMVKAFDSKHAKKGLKDAKVKAVMITGEKEVISLNDLKITSVHKVILEGGKVVEAKAVKIGDKVVKADGTLETIKEITENTTPVTVYNMDVEGADGYIAGGLRVLDYPVPGKK